MTCPEALLKIGFTFLPFVIAFSGTRALSILHLFFVIPAMVVLLTFCLEGLGFLTFSPESPGLFPQSFSSPNFVDWAKWFYFVTYQTYGCETASSFVAESRRPAETLRFLEIAAWLMPPIFLGGSWVIICLATGSNLKDDAFLNLVAASTPFWGKFASLIVTFLLAGSCLLGLATAVSNCPRILYQLAIDQYISPVFSVVSRRGVFGAGLTLTLALSLLLLVWGDVTDIIVLANVPWFLFFMLLHLGLWLQRGKPEVLFPRLSLGIFMLEVVVLVVGGYAWGWQDFLLGLVAPVGVVAVGTLVRYIPFAPFRPSWWMRRFQSRATIKIKDSVMPQISILIFMLCCAVFVGWLFGAHLNQDDTTADENLGVVLLMTVAFVGVAIAGWTSLPQVLAITEAREAAEHLFMVAQDAIVVVNQVGVIRQANPATQSLFGFDPSLMLGFPLKKWLPDLTQFPHDWQKHSEQTLLHNDLVKTLEVSVSDIPHQDFQEYVVILHDITKRKQADSVLRESEAQLREKSQQLACQLVQSEKLSSLGQLVAGVAHEINNPVNFIDGNLSYADTYIQDLLRLLQLYQQHYPHFAGEIQDEAKAIELDFLVEDLPKLLTSMRVGTDRITNIVLSLRNFSRLDEADMKAVDIHEGIDSTLMILEHRLKARPNYASIQIIKEYAHLPPVECYAGQLNQVFMNILSNAIDAIEEYRLIEIDHDRQPTIRIMTQLTVDKQVMIRITDNGPGIPKSAHSKLFDPFFTTKPVGKRYGVRFIY